MSLRRVPGEAPPVFVGAAEPASALESRVGTGGCLTVSFDRDRDFDFDFDLECEPDERAGQRRIGVGA
ncbi:hypothetical protein [Natronolimnohabitans innermongolicus]|uniref:Uncharacterized protein n=1 Tax=Natronolimnohabitans innermongolicus JCM 12255 TaxID=1227499 RepID=L9WVK1_9EURY|nr:hypothetical protein [Natronolimnohabitans innermongolicus]ELY53221.1 hypothetical protein C493_14363 [Natronolimnohabitans innermongolicus JCM 12255]